MLVNICYKITLVCNIFGKKVGMSMKLLSCIGVWRIKYDVTRLTCLILDSVCNAINLMKKVVVTSLICTCYSRNKFVKGIKPWFLSLSQYINKQMAFFTCLVLPQLSSSPAWEMIEIWPDNSILLTCFTGRHSCIGRLLYKRPWGFL